MDMYLGYSHEYTQVHVQYPYITMSHDSYVPLIKPQLKLCTQKGEVYFVRMHTH